METNLLHRIFFDEQQNWEAFKAKHGKKIRPVVVKEVEKFKDCGNPKKGFTLLVCEGCHGLKRVPYRCKEMVFTMKREKKKYRQRMIESFSRDPIQCPCCKGTMELVVIWHADNGRIYYYYNEEYERKQEERWGMRRYEQKRQKQRERESKKRQVVLVVDDMENAEEDFLGLNDPEVFIDFICLACGCIDPVPEFIIGEFSYGLKKG